MNTESRFGLKDSLATAVILAMMLVFILTGILTSADARTGRSSEVTEKTDGVATEKRKVPPMGVSASRRAPDAEVANVAGVESPANL